MAADRSGRMGIATALFVALVSAASAQEAGTEAEPAEAAAPAAPAEESGAAPAEPLATIPVAEPAAPQAPASDTREDATELDVITVTSNKRVQAQRDIPGSVDVLRGEDLEKIKAQGLEDYAKRIPGLVFVDRGADGGQPIIRGIATAVGRLGSQFTQLPVGIFVDDMPFTDLYIPFSQPNLNPFDLERVEVLKGPQGTLFGSGALAGAIRYILQKPKPAVWEYKLGATLTQPNHSEDFSQVYAGAVNIPVYRDEAALRLVGVTRTAAGVIDELERGARDIESLDQYNARLLGNWTVTDRFKLSGFYFAQDTESDNEPFADNPRNFDRTGAKAQLFRTSGLSGTNIVANYAFDWGDFVSSTSYQTKDVVQDQAGPTGQATPTVGPVPGDPDGDGGDDGAGTEDAGQDGIIAFLNSDTRGWFQEFRLSSPEGGDWQPRDWVAVRWLAGAAYQRAEQGFDQYQAAAAADQVAQLIETAPVFPISTPIGPIDPDRNTSVLYAELDGVPEETAVYGEATAQLFEDWELTLGARAFRTVLDVTGFLEGAQVQALDAGNTRYELDRHFEDQDITPKASLRYAFNRNVQVYGLIAKGFQFGGIQLNPPLATLTATVPDAFVQYLSSRLWNYEVGLRTEFLDRRLRWDTTLFYLDWDQLQITIRRPLVQGTESITTIGFTENIGSARSTGVETGLSVSPAQGLTFSSSAAWVKAVTAEDFDSAEGFVQEGTRLPGSPQFQMANVLSYARPFNLLGAWEGGLSLTHAHIGESHNSLQYKNPAKNTRRQGGYDTLDAQISLLKPDWRFTPDLTLSLLNVTDVRGVSAVSSGVGARNTLYYFVPPRTALVSVTLRF